ncbi:MAG: hypothetical protein AB8B97_25315 [Granulosicoccus sp.]
MNTTTTNTDLINPFPGLRPFREGEEHFFFGRERQIDALVDKLGKTRFLAVIGSSGSGKSSLVNCGLLTALRGGLMAEVGTAWKIAQCRPSGQPIRSLASALSEPSALANHLDCGALKLSDILDSNLRMSQRGIVDIAEQAQLEDNVNLLIVVDQFEELFRYTAAEASDSAPFAKAHSEAAEFIKLLLHTQSQVSQPVYIVITMRSDFLGDCTCFEGLAEAINDGQYLVPRMTRDERKLAITGPIAVGGARMDPLLLTQLVNDLGDNPDQLSILQHALNRIWARWSGLGRPEDALNLAHYSSIGSMTLALDHHAEKAYSELSTDRQKLLCEKLFKALTNKATDQRGIRRPTSLRALCKQSDATLKELTQIIDIFRQPSRSFLMPSAKQTLNLDSIIDISHESFMRMWKRLVTWADEEAESSNVFRRLSHTAKLHASGKAGLWRDPDLQLALEWRMRTEPNEVWASRIGPGFQQAMTFLDDSRIASDNERFEELQREAQERELERSKAVAAEQEKRLEAQTIVARKQRQIIALISTGLILTTTLLIVANYANRQKERAEEEQTNKKNVVDVLVSARQEQTAFNIEKRAARATIKAEHQSMLSVAVGLVNQGRQVTQEFIHDAPTPLWLYTVDATGNESGAVSLAPGTGTRVDGYVNQIWTVRPATSDKLYATGAFSESETIISLESQD